MDLTAYQDHVELCNKQIELAQEYDKQRIIAGNAKTELEIRLTSALPSIRLEKPNVGVEMAYLLLMEFEPDTKNIYRQWKEAESKYKGIEKLIEAYASKISFQQSLMRYVSQGEKFG